MSHLYFVVFKSKKDNDNWRIFTNEIWDSEKEAIDYAKRNKFKKSIEWKVVPYDHKYFKI